MNYYGRLTLLLTLSMFAMLGQTEINNLPPEVQEVLIEVGPVWGENIRGNIQKTADVLTPVLQQSPKDGVEIKKNISYGDHASQELDVYYKSGTLSAPVVVFVHGGAYVRGTRNRNSEISANIPIYFARHGMVGVNTDYRLAPEVTWPKSAEDLGAVVRWLKENVGEFGGDPNRIYLIGSSAGATHVATYAFNKSLHPDSGPGIAGVVLLSGRYRIDPRPDDPNAENVRAYFGTDPDRYPEMSVINHIQNVPKIPVYLVIAEYDNPNLDVEGAMLFAAICERDRKCPRFSRFAGHNHLSTEFSVNTPGDVLGPQVIEFIRNGR